MPRPGVEAPLKHMRGGRLASAIKRLKSAYFPRYLSELDHACPHPWSFQVLEGSWGVQASLCWKKSSPQRTLVMRAFSQQSVRGASTGLKAFHIEQSLNPKQAHSSGKPSEPPSQSKSFFPAF